MSEVAVVGGGAAGMFAAIAAASAGHAVSLFEKNEKLGKKIYITGKGRCNLTNACPVEEIFEHIPRNPKFLYSAVYAYDNARVIDFFEGNGMRVKTERGNRVFPVSDHSSDVIDTLKKVLQQLHVRIYLHAKVEEVLTQGNAVTGVRAGGRDYPADAVIVATGGLSYPSTGSTGDGYRFARKMGHSIERLAPSLVPMNVRGDDCKSLQGLSLRNVSMEIRVGGKVLYQAFGEMLFTHFGVSGPLVLSASSIVNERLMAQDLDMELDLKPALSESQLDDRVLRDFEKNKNRQFKNALGGLLPAKMIPVMVAKSGICPEKKIHDVTKEERRALVSLLKHFPLTLCGLRDFQEAVITRGGVNVKEIDPSTMESKLVRGLYFAGEVLDVDACTGGFNLQIAWSTGYLAGSSIRGHAYSEKRRDWEESAK